MPCTEAGGCEINSVVRFDAVLFLTPLQCAATTALYYFAVSKSDHLIGQRLRFKSRGRILNDLVCALYYCVMYITSRRHKRFRNPITFLIFSPKRNHRRHHQRAAADS